LSLGAVHEVVAGKGWSYVFICTELTKTYLTSLVKYCGNIQSPTNKKAIYVPNTWQCKMVKMVKILHRATEGWR
jgi:hypothetical protein